MSGSEGGKEASLKQSKKQAKEMDEIRHASRGNWKARQGALWSQVELRTWQKVSCHMCPGQWQPLVPSLFEHPGSCCNILCHL